MLKKFSANTRLFILFSLINFMALAGCATLFSDGEDVVTFNSNVDKTKVFLDGSKIGETPLTLAIDRRLQNRTLKFVKEGYQTQEMMLAKKFNNNTAMILDITGTVTFLTPLIVDALSGNMIKYSPTDYHIEMVSEKTGDLKIFRQRVTSMRFAAHNFPDIQRELVTGEGEFLEGLQDSFHIPPDHKETFEKTLQENLDILITADNGLEFWNHLNQLFKDDPVLSAYRFG